MFVRFLALWLNSSRSSLIRLGCLIIVLQPLINFTARVSVFVEVTHYINSIQQYEIPDETHVIIGTLWFGFQSTSTPTGSWLLFQSSF